MSRTAAVPQVRGGLALSRQYRFLAEEGVLQLRTDRRAHVPCGLLGGRDGTPSSNLLWRDGEMRELPAKCRLTIRRGDVFRHVLGGAEGWGDPAERDPQRVAHDVAEDKLSAEYAAASTAWRSIRLPGELQCPINQAADGLEPSRALPAG